MVEREIHSHLLLLDFRCRISKNEVWSQIVKSNNYLNQITWSIKQT